MQPDPVLWFLKTYGEAKLAPDTEVPCYLIRNYEKEGSQEPPTDVGGEGVAVYTAESSHELEEDEELSSFALKVYRVCAYTTQVEDFSMSVSTKSTAKT